MKFNISALVLLACVLPVRAGAEQVENVANASAQTLAEKSPFQYGPYATVSGSYVRPGDSLLSQAAYGGAFALGWRKPTFGIEFEGFYDRLETKETSASIGSYGAELAVLGFPLSSDRNFYFLAGGGANAYQNSANSKATFNNGLIFDVGLGHMLSFHVGTYEMAARLEGRFRHEQVSVSSMPDDPRTTAYPPVGDSAQVKFNDFIVSLGLQFPLGSPHRIAAQQPEPARIVPVESASGPAAAGAPTPVVPTPVVPTPGSNDAAPIPSETSSNDGSAGSSPDAPMVSGSTGQSGH